MSVDIDEFLSLRKVSEKDNQFLLSLYRSVRYKELSQVDWTEKQKEQFTEMQFALRHNQYLSRYPNASFQIVLYQGVQVGCLFVDEGEDEVRVVDIALKKNYQGRGIGTCLLKKVITRADASSKLVSLHVELSNPAIKLYQRLGFQRNVLDDVYCYMSRMSRCQSL